MKKWLVYSFWLVIIYVIVLVPYLIYDFQQTNIEEVNNLNTRTTELEKKITDNRAALAIKPDDRSLATSLSKLQMEKALLKLPYMFQFEMVENGLLSFAGKLLGAAEKRQQNLRRLLIKRTLAVDVSECPRGFQQLFRHYASNEGLNVDNLTIMREFAESYEAPAP